MTKSLKIIVVALIFLMSASAVKAQDFPANEKDVTDILSTGKWALDSLGRPGKMRTATEANMQDVTLTFKSDGTYTITVFGKDKVGKWTLDMEDKQVKMFEGRTDPDSIIKTITKEQLVMGRGDGSELKMIFRPAK